jgi:type I restriction enzyme S subunit
LVREYRIRLIADVVTGKLDVREAAARLPQDVDELEPLGEAEADNGVDADVSETIDAIPEEAEA